MFSIGYLEHYQGWVIFKDGKVWEKWIFKDEWEAIDVLKLSHPEEAKELEMIYSCVG